MSEGNTSANTDADRRPPGFDSDPARRWNRELAHLRRRMIKIRLEHTSPVGEVLDESLNLCASLLQELAGAHLTIQRLNTEVRQEVVQWEYLFEHMPVPCIATDANGTIVAGNPLAARLLNLSNQRLKDRLLLHFAVDRDAFGAFLRTMRYEAVAQQTSLSMRPRERAPVDTQVVVIPQAPGDTTRWLWFFMPTGAGVNGPREPRARSRAPGGEPHDAPGTESDHAPGDVPPPARGSRNHDEHG